MHPFLLDLRRARYALPLSAAAGEVQHLRPVGGPGPIVSDAAADDVNLAVDDAGGGELAADAHGGAAAPAVEAAVEEPDVGGGNVVDGAADDVDGGAEDGVGGADGGGGEGGEGDEAGAGGGLVERVPEEGGGA